MILHYLDWEYLKGFNFHGYVWYKNGIVPEQPGLKYDLLTEMVVGNFLVCSCWPPEWDTKRVYSAKWNDRNYYSPQLGLVSISRYTLGDAVFLLRTGARQNGEFSVCQLDTPHVDADLLQLHRWDAYEGVEKC